MLEARQRIYAAGKAYQASLPPPKAPTTSPPPRLAPLPSADAIARVQAALDGVPARFEVKDIQAAVGDHFQISVADIKSEKRHAPIVKARQVSIYLCTVLTEYSISQIGRFHGRDPSTANHSLRRFEGKDRERFKDDLAAIESKLSLDLRPVG